MKEAKGRAFSQLADYANAILSGELRFTFERPVIYPVLVCFEPL